MNQSLRILHTESSTGLGGQEFRVISEAAGMVQRGHVVILAVPSRSALYDLAVQERIHIEPISLKKSRYVQLVFEFLAIIRQHSIQIINTHGSLDSWTASIAGRLSAQKPIVIRTRHKSTSISNNFRHRVLYRTLPHAIISTGEVIRENLIREMDVDGSRVTSIPTGINVESFDPGQRYPCVRHSYGLSSNQFLVGSIAFLRDYKGLEFLIEAAKLVIQQLPDVRFLIVGSGPQESDLLQRIHQLGLKQYVMLAGYKENIPEILNAIDLFVLPSVGGEGLPQALTQAMAAQRPVIATPVGSVTEVVQHGVNGLLVSPRDPKSLAESIVLLVRDPSLRERLARSGREAVMKSYDFEGMLDKTEDLYARLLGSDFSS